MEKVKYVRADQIEPGDLIAHPRSGTKYEVAKVSTEDGKTNIRYVPGHYVLGVTVKAARPMARWRKE